MLVVILVLCQPTTENVVFHCLCALAIFLMDDIVGRAIDWVMGNLVSASARRYLLGNDRALDKPPMDIPWYFSFK
jgi:hypothetical protein